MEKLSKKQELSIDEKILTQDIMMLILAVSAPLYYTWMNSQGANMAQWLIYVTYAVCGGSFVKSLQAIKKDLKQIRKDRQL